MRQKKIVNIIIVVASSSLLLLLWSNGLEWLYGKLLSIGANLLLLPWPDTSISLYMEDGKPIFIVRTLFEGRPGSFPQEGNLFLLPFIMILTWQVLLFFNLDLRKALMSAIWNTGIFFLAQMVFLLLLTGYYKSEVAKFIFDMLLDSFYILALFLIVKDTVRYRLIKLTQE